MLRSLRLSLISGTASAFAVAALAACGAHDSSGRESAPASVAQAYDTQADLISPATCTLLNSRLSSCVIGTRLLDGQDITTAVPLRTTFTVHKSGNCSTQYALEVTFTAAGAADVRLPFLSTTSAAIRRTDGQPISEVTMTDSSPWTHFASLDQTCRVSLTIASNEPDVNSTADAQAIITALSQDLAAKTVIRDRYSDLLNYQKAYDFLSSVITYFHTELTSDAMQQLRTDSETARPTVMKMILASACGGTLTDDEFGAIVSLYESLAVLGSPSSWTNPDGGTKTNADFVGADAAKILDTVTKLSQQQASDGGSNYAAAYQAAANDVVQAQAKLDLAKAQLASWLGS